MNYMRINGRIENIEILNDQVKYDILKENKRYNVMSKDRQAVKDAIFLRQGQIIKINGMADGDMILVEDARIDITKTGV